MESRLDAVLERTREPQPVDERFVRSVIAEARADRQRVRRRRRVVLQPLALAAAAAIIVGSGVAALVRSTDVTPDAAMDTTQAPTIAPTTPGRVQEQTPAVPVPPAADVGETTSVRRGDLEWGYASGTSAYAVDHETGLRLDTQISKTEFDTDVPQRIRLKLTNTGRRPVAVSAPGGCALMVNVYPDDSVADDHSWRCANASDEPGVPGTDSFVLGPGGTHVGEATIVLANGDWRVVGMCRCSYQTAAKSSPRPDDNPIDELPELGTGLLSNPTPEQRTADKGSPTLVTPPIRVKAT
ncbi:MAG: hypothetical protein ACRDKJ_05380 [Actinomycetota bacterium]